MKNKNLLWMLWAVILVILSVGVMGFSLRDLGASIGGVTGGTSIVFLIVNTLLIGTFIFLAIHFLPEKLVGKIKPGKSNTAKSVFFIALLIVSVVFAIRIGNMFIWHEDAVVRPAFRYLFGVDEEGNIGILRPTRILIFIGASALLYWLFVTKVKIGQGKNDSVDLVIAILLAADMTHQGLTKDWLIAGGQLIAIWILYGQFKKEGETKFSWSSAVWSYGLITWISSVAFPGEGFFFVRWAGALFSKMGLYGSLLTIVIIGVALTALGAFVIKKEKDEEDKEKESRWKKDMISYPLWGLHRWAGRSRNPLVRGIYKLWDPKLPTPEDEIPFPFRDIRVEFMTMMNYLLRLEVYKAKKGFMVKTQELADKMYGKKGLHQVFEPARIHGFLNQFKNGGEFGLFRPGGLQKSSEGLIVPVGAKPVKIPEKHADWYNNPKIFDGNYKPVRKIILDENKKETVLEAGFNTTEWWVFELINNLKREVEELTHIKQGSNKGEEIRNTLEKRMKHINERLNSVERRYGTYSAEEDGPKAFVQRKGALNLIEGRRLWMLDQYRLAGKYDHTYKFARKGATVYKVPLQDQGPDPWNDTLKKSPKLYWGRGEKSKKPIPENNLVEVDFDGYFLQDLNEYRIEHKNRGYIRRVTPVEEVEVKQEIMNKNTGQVETKKVKKKLKNIKDHVGFNSVNMWIDSEWEFFIRDIRDGRYHPNSRSAKDYTDLHAKRSFNYRDVKALNKGVGRENPAFDREKLLSPSVYYIGRKKFDGVSDADVTTSVLRNPALSTLGLRNYILSYLETKMKTDDRFRENVSRYAYDTGAEHTEIFTTLPSEAKQTDAKSD